MERGEKHQKTEGPAHLHTFLACGAEGAFIKFNPPVGWAQPFEEGGGAQGLLGRGGGGVVPSWRQEAPSEPADKQCFQTRGQGGSNGKVVFRGPALSLSGHGGLKGRGAVGGHSRIQH